MPGYDGSGPRGEGPLTGRGFGSCKGKGFGFGKCGRGLGRGLGRRVSFNKEEEKKILEEGKKTIEEKLKEFD